MVIDISADSDGLKEVRKLAIQNSLSRAQIMALETLKSPSSEEYQNVLEPSPVVIEAYDRPFEGVQQFVKLSEIDRAPTP